MWWEWEGDGEEAAREDEETPVDFDFISLLAKPKVRRDLTPPATVFFLRFRGPILGCGGRANWALWKGTQFAPLACFA
jgi:hypothetical protein